MIKKVGRQICDCDTHIVFWSQILETKEVQSMLNIYFVPYYYKTFTIKNVIEHYVPYICTFLSENG